MGIEKQSYPKATGKPEAIRAFSRQHLPVTMWQVQPGIPHRTTMTAVSCHSCQRANHVAFGIDIEPV